MVWYLGLEPRRAREHVGQTHACIAALGVDLQALAVRAPGLVRAPAAPRGCGLPVTAANLSRYTFPSRKYAGSLLGSCACEQQTG